MPSSLEHIALLEVQFAMELFILYSRLPSYFWQMARILEIPIPLPFGRLPDNFKSFPCHQQNFLRIRKDSPLESLNSRYWPCGCWHTNIHTSSHTAIHTPSFPCSSTMPHGIPPLSNPLSHTLHYYSAVPPVYSPQSLYKIYPEEASSRSQLLS